MSRIKPPRLDSLPGRFHDLVRLFPPHAIEDDVDYENTVEVMEALLRIRRRAKGQAHYLETLTQLIHAYDVAHDPDHGSGRTPIGLLRELLDRNGMNASDLGTLLGNRALGSKLLREERMLSKAHIRTLSARFRVDPGLFLRAHSQE